MAKKKSVSEEIKEEVKVPKTKKEESVSEEIKEEVAAEKPIIEKVESAPLIEKGVVNVEMVNVRAEATMEAPIVTMLAKGTIVTIDPEKSAYDFYKVSSSGVQGFIRKDLIDLV